MIIKDLYENRHYSVNSIYRRVTIKHSNDPNPTFFCSIRYKLINPILIPYLSYTQKEDAYIGEVGVSPQRAFDMRKGAKEFLLFYCLKGDFILSTDDTIQEITMRNHTYTFIAKLFQTAHRYTPESQLNEISHCYDVIWEEDKLVLLGNPVEIQTEYVIVADKDHEEKARKILFRWFGRVEPDRVVYKEILYTPEGNPIGEVFSEKENLTWGKLWNKTFLKKHKIGCRNLEIAQIRPPVCQYTMHSLIKGVQGCYITGEGNRIFYLCKTSKGRFYLAIE